MHTQPEMHNQTQPHTHTHTHTPAFSWGQTVVPLMQVSVEQELSAQEKKLNDRITALETSVQGKLKKGK